MQSAALFQLVRSGYDLIVSFRIYLKWFQCYSKCTLNGNKQFQIVCWLGKERNANLLKFEVRFQLLEALSQFSVEWIQLIPNLVFTGLSAECGPFVPTMCLRQGSGFNWGRGCLAARERLRVPEDQSSMKLSRSARGWMRSQVLRLTEVDWGNWLVGKGGRFGWREEDRKGDCPLTSCIGVQRRRRIKLLGGEIASSCHLRPVLQRPQLIE